MSNDRELELRFAGVPEVARWFASGAGRGSVEVECGEAAPGDELWLTLQVEGEGSFSAHARVVERLDATRALCTVMPRAGLRELLARYALERRSGRIAPMGSQRRHPRFDTCLAARFRSYQQLVSEYVFNISAGGMYLRCDDPPALGSQLTVEVTFPDGQRHEVSAEVIWRAEADPCQPERPPGVGVRFLESGPFTVALEQLLTSYLARRPRVLLVDDDRLILQVLKDGLLAYGMEVATADTGERASHLLSELLYELDMVVLDLQMPGLGGRELLQRVRRLGFEMDLRIAIVSAAEPAELSSLVGPGGADLALPKSLGPPAILERLVALARNR